MSFSRPKTQEELEKREAIGVIRASGFVRDYARSHEPIMVETICEIHNHIFAQAIPEIAGQYRTEDIVIKDSSYIPPHHWLVRELMHTFGEEIQEKIQSIGPIEGRLMSTDEPDDEVLSGIENTVHMAAWIHHKVTWIHPFINGNGRTARLSANLILERCGLIGISVKIEKENKNRYRQALSQIDQRWDYEPLMDLLFEGIFDRYEGIPMKYYDFKKG